jgi:hypothetical protein
MNAFEQSNMNMIAHNRVLPEVGSYILQVDAYMIVHINRQKLNQHFQSILCYISKIWKRLRARKQSSLPFP